MTKERTVSVNDLTFGIEIETTVPRDVTLEIGEHRYGLPIPEMPGWKADRDPSIHAGRDRRGCEFVSPVLRGPEGLRQLLADVEKIKRHFRAKVNSSCGLHIHVGFDKTNRDACERLATLVSHFEKAIFASTGTKERERGTWCGSIRRHGNASAALRQSESNRYHVANFGTTNPTIEFRPFAATLEADRIVGYLRLCLGLVERALETNRATAWTPKPAAPAQPAAPVSSVPPVASPAFPATPPAPQKDGQTAVKKLFYGLGWTKGRLPRTFGELSADGVPPLARTKHVFTNLAKKYDQDR
jgi:hypothetical protein